MLKIEKIEVTRQFLSRAREEVQPVEIGPQPGRYPKNVVSKRNFDITNAYIGTEQTLQEVGDQYQKTRERIRQIVNKTILKVWANCSPATQELFPLRILTTDKPLSLAVRQRMSQQHGGAAVTVLEMLKRGNAIEDVRRSLKNPRDFKSSRQALKRWGIIVPALIKTSKEYDIAKGLADPTQKDEGIRQLLSKVTLHYYLRDLKAENRTLIPVSVEVKVCGYHVDHDRSLAPFLASLDKAGIPVVSLVYNGKGKRVLTHLFASQHSQRVRRTLLEDESLRQFSQPLVRQVAGPPTETPPTVYQIQQGGRFIAPGSILIELGIDYRSKIGKTIMQAALGNSEIPIFFYGPKYHLDISQKEAFKKYVLNLVAQGI